MSEKNIDTIEYKPAPDDIQVQLQIIEAKGLYKSELFGINPYVAVYALQEK